ncbi:MAG TPA: crotonase/enoyl-CoA hydratase family protein [Deltaproteobacteria bacterium]|nr:crotonase/enoyl-CoA hydratase family protein [Deltaproteobacteria bacterium]
MKVYTETKDKILTVVINRPEVKNAVDRETAYELSRAFREFDANDDLYVAILCGEGDTFCAGADLKAVADGSSERANSLEPDMSKDGPMGPTRMMLTKPVIAAISGYAVAGGLELALWCDLRVADEDAILGVFCRRFGVPLVDGGTQRLPRLIGMSRALDMILTGRPVTAKEAYDMGLVNRVVPNGMARQEAESIASQISRFPQRCLRSDRYALYRGFDLDFNKAMELEFSYGLEVISSGETISGAKQFTGGTGRHGKF